MTRFNLHLQPNSYVHVPPPEDEAEQAHHEAIAQAPRKTYKIIFIKAPSHAGPSPQALAAQAQNSEKTLIYVLVKKPEEVNYESPEQPGPLAPSKPEVYFIKYKTQKEQGGGGGSFGGGSSAGAGSFGGGSSAGAGSFGGGSDFGGAPQNPQSSYGPPHK